uniref:Uncharacterized protein n=1 Tax=Acrobeloides nanus TaxID=290746 RepID=A0A914DSX9_9BILA
MKKLSLFLFFLGLFSASESLRRQFRPGFINGTPLRDHYAKQFIDLDAYTDCLNNPEKFNVKRFNFTQPLDHFNSSETRKWSQQTQWRNDTFKPKSDGDIVFLLIGGEGPAPLPLICFTTYTWGQLAVEHGAFMFQLEHRYFGTSSPTSDMSVPNLKWLTTEQALADVNAFIPAMNKIFNFNKPKWVVFGGSYPGTISALLRMVYPNITNGNIASSAPLWPKLDMWEYAVKMEEAILWESQVNSTNKDCYNETKAAFEYIRNATYTATGRAELNGVFNPQPPLGSQPNFDFDATNFLAGVYDVFQWVIQYSFDERRKINTNVTDLNVANLCGYMVDQKYNYTQRLYNAYIWFMASNGYTSPQPFDNDYWGDIEELRNTSFLSDQAYFRGWMWLCCNEFGWLLTTDNGYGIFQNLIPLGYYLRYCEDMFDSSITSDYAQKNVAKTLKRYGLPWDYNGTNIVLSNGSLDPWSTLGCNVSDDNVHRKVRTTVGGAHCVDLYPYTANSSENPDVANTINLIKQEVAYYLTLAGPYGGSNGMDTTIKATPLILIFGFVLCFVKLL